MKSLSVLLLVVSFYSAFSQDVRQNTIRVVGQHKEVLKANAFELVFEIQEVTSLSAGERQVIKTITEVKNDVQRILKDKKFFVGELKALDINLPKFGNRNTTFSIVVTDIAIASEIVQVVKTSGLNSISVKYKFSQTDDFLNQLAAKALENSKAKATYLASKANRKVGKLLIIDDNTDPISLFGPSSTIPDRSDKSMEQEVTYNLFVTYELLD